MKNAYVLIVSTVLAAVPVAAQDHPLVGSFQGSTQVGYQVSEYDETSIIVGPINDRTSSQQTGDGWKRLEGKITYVYYKLPDGRSSLEALRNYEQSLKQKGFDVAFTCSTEAGTCFSSGKFPGLFLGLALDGSTDLPKLGLGDFVRNFFGNGNGRYLYAKMNGPNGLIHVSLAFSDDASRGRTVIGRVIETTEMETGQIVFKEAAVIKGELETAGGSDIYGIQFDFDKAEIKPESEPQLKAIADLLAKDGALRLDIVGHTDNQGGDDYNRDLSQRRAEAVVAALAGNYGIEQERLTPVGQGPSRPLASNESEDGRALNRRVELVRR